MRKSLIAEKTGLTVRQLQFYTEQGVVTPEIDAGEGRGKSRRYSDHNLFQFSIIKGLVELGITIRKIKEIMGGIDISHKILNTKSTKCNGIRVTLCIEREMVE